MQIRLGTRLHMVLDLEIEDTVHIVDESIILGMITYVSLKFDAYTAPRVTEIQTNCSTNSW